jgi:hypothetical protein
MLKQIITLCLITAITTPALAYKIRVQATSSKQTEVIEWKLKDSDKDGWAFMLEKDKFLFIHAYETVRNGVSADTVIVACMEYTENDYKAHLLKPGSTLICKGHPLLDAVYLTYDIDHNQKFINGAAGTAEYLK